MMKTDVTDNCINGLRPDVSVYRIFPPLHFIDVLIKKKLTLVRPSAWEDKYENILFKRTVNDGDGNSISIESLQNALWGQCWSQTKENDGMWRIYSPNKDGVKVRSTPRKLLQAIWKEPFNSSQIKCFIGKVSYRPEKKIVKWFSDSENVKLLMIDGTGKGPVLGLLLKRIEFKHEDEVRLIYHNGKCAGKPVVHFDIDPNQLFEEVVLDSRMPGYLAETLIVNLRKIGFTNPINKSSLYDEPPPATATF
jgi:hypothetical protein